LPKMSDFREQAVAKAEREYLQKLMSICSEDINHACQLSGLSRSRLYELLKKHRMQLKS